LLDSIIASGCHEIEMRVAASFRASRAEVRAEVTKVCLPAHPPWEGNDLSRISAGQPVWRCYSVSAVSAAGVIVPKRPSFWLLGPAVKNSVSELDLAPPPRVRVHSPSIVSGLPSRPLT